MELDLESKVVVVTGASAGIGREIALQFANEGSAVVAVARRAELLDELANEAAPGRILALPADLTEQSDREQLVERVLSQFGSVDVLVNNAGYSRPVPIVGEVEAWNDAFDLNFHAVRRLTELVLPDMLARKHGAVVNIAGKKEPYEMNASGPAKVAAIAWAKALSREVAAQGIRVNNVIPGKIRSEQIDTRIAPTQEARDQLAANIPMRRLGVPADLAPLVLFLASSQARYLTGQSIAVDGGLQSGL